MKVTKPTKQTNHHPTRNTVFTYVYKLKFVKLLNYTTNILFEIFQSWESFLAY